MARLSLSALLSVTVFIINSAGYASCEEVTNLVVNPSFEDDLRRTWKTGGCQLTQNADDKLHGQYSAMCIDRDGLNQGPMQDIQALKKGGRYAFTGYVKLLNDIPGVIWQRLKVIITFKFDDDERKKTKKTKSCKGLKGAEKKKCRDKARKQRKEEKRRKRDERRKKKKEEKKRRKNKEKKAKKDKKNKKNKSGKKNRHRKPKKDDGTVTKTGSEERLSQAERDQKSGTADETSRVTREAGHARTTRTNQRKRARREKEKRRRKQRRKMRDGSDEDSNSYIIAYRGFLTSQQGWVLVTGNLNAPMKDIRSARLAIRGPDAGVSFLVDNVTLWEVPEHPDWEGQARINIDKYRKSNMRFRVTLPLEVKARDVEIQIDHKKHLFAFGGLVEDDLITETHPQALAFQRLFSYLFNWATVGSWKWKYGKPLTKDARDEPVYRNYGRAEAATDALLQKGFKVRAHAILWGFEKNNLDPVVQLSGADLKETVFNRVKYIVEKARGKVVHWDVQNEYIHGHFYEEVSQDPNITINAFKLTRQLDPGVKLFLNDFQAVTTGANTEDYYDLAQRFKAAGTGIQGLGIQGHTKDYVKPDPTMIWKRLDRLSETGLELFMSEFDIPWDDVYERADWLEDAFRAFFAHPGLGGVILWGFWKERQTYKNMFLVEGEDLQMVEPGYRYACLVKKEWSTHVTKNLGESGLTFDLRGFQGDYEVILKRSGVPVQRQAFSLGKEDVTVDITVTSSTTPIEVPAEEDLVPQCVSHRGNHSLGQVTSTINDQSLGLTCEDHLSEPSELYEGAMTEVMCPAGWAMTGCSSVSEDSRTGEKIVVEDGVPKCRATSAGCRRKGVYAIARCCSAKTTITCDYQVAGPSLAFDGAQAEAKCTSGFFPFGCSAYSQCSDFDGTFPDVKARSCVAQSGSSASSDPRNVSGVVVTAACCQATGVQCIVEHSTDTVACPQNYVMTGCSAFSEDGGTLGAAIVKGKGNAKDACEAESNQGKGPNSSTVIAYATCCALG